MVSKGKDYKKRDEYQVLNTGREPNPLVLKLGVWVTSNNNREKTAKRVEN